MLKRGTSSQFLIFFASILAILSINFAFSGTGRASLYLTVADAYLSQGERAAAERQLLSAIEAGREMGDGSPDHWQASHAYAGFLEAEGDLEHACAQLKGVLNDLTNCSPESLSCHLNLIRLLHQSEHFEEARALVPATLRIASALDQAAATNQATAFDLLCQSELGSFDRDWLSSAVTVLDADLEGKIYRQLAVSYLQRLREVQGVSQAGTAGRKLLQKSVSSQGDFASLALQVGILLEQGESLSAAEAAYLQALSAAQEAGDSEIEANSLLLLADLNEQEGRRPIARNYLERANALCSAVQLTPDTAACITLSQALFIEQDAGSPREVEELLRTALRLAAPGTELHILCQSHLARSLCEQGRAQEGRDTLRHAQRQLRRSVQFDEDTHQALAEALSVQEGAAS